MLSSPGSLSSTPFERTKEHSEKLLLNKSFFSTPSLHFAKLADCLLFPGGMTGLHSVMGRRGSILAQSPDHFSVRARPSEQTDDVLRTIEDMLSSTTPLQCAKLEFCVIYFVLIDSVPSSDVTPSLAFTGDSRA